MVRPMARIKSTCAFKIFLVGINATLLTGSVTVATIIMAIYSSMLIVRGLLMISSREGVA